MEIVSLSGTAHVNVNGSAQEACHDIYSYIRSYIASNMYMYISKQTPKINPSYGNVDEIDNNGQSHKTRYG